MLKMAAEFPSRRDQLIFLMNNYDMMLSVLMVSWLVVERQQPGRSLDVLSMSECCLFVQERAADDSKEVEGFQQLLLARTQVTSPVPSSSGSLPFRCEIHFFYPSRPGVHRGDSVRPLRRDDCVCEGGGGSGGERPAGAPEER